MEKKLYGTVLLKAAKIMDVLSETPSITLQELAKKSELTTSTAIKILETLAYIGYVERDHDKKYRLGTKLIRYANQSIDQINLLEISRPYLEELQQTIDETIHLGLLTNQEILYIDKLEPKNQTILMSSKVGITRPLYSSAMGKAVLAKMTTEQYEHYLETHPLVPYTENTITNSIKLNKEIEKVKITDIAYDDEEMEKDIFCIGTSIIHNDQIIGAFSLSMPKYRFSPEKQEPIIDAILLTKQHIENSLV